MEEIQEYIDKYCSKCIHFNNGRCDVYNCEVKYGLIFCVKYNLEEYEND